MIRDVGGETVYVTVISKGRPGNVEAMNALIGPATWYVPVDERETYLDAGAPSTRADGLGLCVARNRALEDAFSEGAACVQLSDDLQGLGRLLTLEDGKAAAEPTTFDGTIQAMREEAFLHSAKLAGCAPTSNPFYASPRTSPNLFILGDLMLIEPTDLRFDTKLRLKEDYDYTCQHFARYGAVARVGYLIPQFQHRTNAGGAVADRTAELEQESIAHLKAKWGDWIRDNPRRPNEILLRLPRPKGAKL